MPERFRRWCWVKLLAMRGWPDPRGTLDWLEHRQQFMDGDDD